MAGRILRPPAQDSGRVSTPLRVHPDECSRECSFVVSIREIVTTLTATLALRPVGALLFGLLADRYGRRIPLMANVIYFAIIEVLCGFAPNFTVFLILRALFGIGMGGEWGVGASLAMEAAPVRWRGILSGILQSGSSPPPPLP